MTLRIGDKEFSDSDLQVLAKHGLLNIGQKNDPASTTLTGPALHGPWQGNSSMYGLWSSPGVRPGRFSAMVRPDSFLGMIPFEKSNFTNEILEIQTGVTAATAANATGFCGNPPVFGNLKTCQQTFTWGDFYAKTNLNAGALIGQQRSRADVPGNIINAAPEQRNRFIPDIMYRLDDGLSQLQHELYIMGVGMERSTELVAVQGVAGTQNNTYTGWFTQFKGLDGQIKTGYADVSGYLCPAADSTVVAFNANITGSSADGSSRTFTATLIETYRAKKSLARKVGMPTTVFVILMREEQFHRAADVIACGSDIYQCAGTQYAEVNRDGARVQDARLAMMNGQYLMIDGVQVPVVFSEGIPNPATGSNVYSADIAIVPISWEGLPLLRMEYYPMDNTYTTEYMNAFGLQTAGTLNDGLFLVGKRDTGLCVEFHFQARMRLILETPFLAARIDDVQYSFYEPIREAIPGTSRYLNGGVSYRS